EFPELKIELRTNDHATCDLSSPLPARSGECVCSTLLTDYTRSLSRVAPVNIVSQCGEIRHRLSYQRFESFASGYFFYTFQQQSNNDHLINENAPKRPKQQK
ncbi:hypothetical protein L9F63_004698, partial [Diploptera punctata]